MTPPGNPAMPMKLPEALIGIQGKELPVATSIMSLMPGFQHVAINMMRTILAK
ncbi:MAG: hypothetical protein KDI27_07175 [Gammaproteobacteria bacterium]|nr:hypothetical protein [Gammaproteobacteria bacterium]